MYPSLFGNLDIEKAKYLNLAEIIGQVNELLETKSRLQLKSEIAEAESIRKKMSDGTVSISDRKAANDILGMGMGESLFIDGIRLTDALEKTYRGLEEARRIHSPEFIQCSD